MFETPGTARFREHQPHTGPVIVRANVSHHGPPTVTPAILSTTPSVSRRLLSRSSPTGAKPHRGSIGPCLQLQERGLAVSHSRNQTPAAESASPDRSPLLGFVSDCS